MDVVDATYDMCWWVRDVTEIIVEKLYIVKFRLMYVFEERTSLRLSSTRWMTDVAYLCGIHILIIYIFLC